MASTFWLTAAVAVIVSTTTVPRINAQAQAHVNVVPGASRAGCLNATQAQLSAGVNCSCIGYALQLLEKYVDTIPALLVTVHYDQNFTEGGDTRIQLSSSSQLQTTVNITGFNHTRRTVTCSRHDSGVTFVGFKSVAISYVHWKGCGTQHNTTAFYTWLDPSLFPIKAFSALFFFQCYGVYLDHSVFSDSMHGSGASIYDCSNILVQNCDFLNNSISSDLLCHNTSQNGTCSPQATGLYLETTQCGGFTKLNCSSTAMATHQGPVFNISNCTFVGNANYGAYTAETKHSVPTSLDDHWPFGMGGGFNLALRGNVTGLEFMLSNCMFANNHGKKGGGMAIELHPKFSNVTISLTGSKFINNSADDSGGGLRLGVVYEQSLESGAIKPGNITLRRCLFQNNVAKRWGGGTSVYSGTNAQFISSVEMHSCNWTGNQANHSAPALGITSSQFGISWNTTISPICRSCTFLNNRVIVVTGESRVAGYGAVFLQGVPMSLTGNTVFEENSATALCISSSSVELHDNVTFRGNKGIKGGAVLLLGTSWINLAPNLTLLFENNTAFRDGGAIYYTYPPSLSLKDFKDCFIQYLDRGVPFHRWNVTVKFAGNNAFQNGDAVYISNLKECAWTEGSANASNPFSATNSTTSYPFSYEHQRPRDRAVSTPPVRIDFNLLARNDTNTLWNTYSVMPGEKFDFEVKITDFFHIETSSVVSAACHDVSDYLNYNFHRDLCKNGTYALEGLPSSFGLSHNTSMRNLNIQGRPNSTILLVMVTHDLQPVVTPILINLTECHNGFVLTKSKPQTCECFRTLMYSRYDNFLCIDTVNGTKPCVRYGYWYGNIQRTNHEQEIHGVQTCLYGACKAKCTPCDHLSKHEWCSLPQNESDICKEHRYGPLCSQCKNGYTLTYDSFSCAQCSAGSYVGLWVLFVIYWLFVFFQLIAIIKLDFKVGSGYMYAFLYYFSVLKYIMWYGTPTPHLTRLVKVFATLSRLDPVIYALTDLCLYPNVTSVQYEASHYIHPLVILMVVALLIALSHYFPRFSIFSGNYAIQAICYVILLAYTSLSETSLDILNPMTYEMTHPRYKGTLVQIQPGTDYMDPTEHLPYALLALIVEIIIVLPFSFFMLLAPFLARYVNLIKVKPILDEYQNCYKDQYRWFAGVYLIGRQIFFLTSIWAIHLEISQLLNQIFCVLLLVLLASIHPYRQRLLNYIDMFFLANLTLLTLFFSGSGVTALRWNSKTREIVVAITITLPCLYFFILLIVGLGYCCGRRRNRRIKAPTLSHSMVTNDQPELPPPPEVPEVVDDELPPRFFDEELEHRRLSVSTNRSNSEAEPLLGSTRTHSWYQRLGAKLSRSYNQDRGTHSATSSN